MAKPLTALEQSSLLLEAGRGSREAGSPAREAGLPACEAVAPLARFYADRLWAFFRARGASPNESDELAQETLIRLWQKAAAYRPESPVASWVFGIARKVRKEFLRRKKADPERSRSVPLEEADAAGRLLEVASRDRSETTRIVRESRKQRLEEVWGELEETDRSVLLEHFHQDRSYQEIADLTGMTAAAVRQRACRALLELRRLLNIASENSSD